jgi:hypothetical protein
MRHVPSPVYDMTRRGPAEKWSGQGARRQWKREVVQDQILFLWAKAMEPVNIKIYFVAMYGAVVVFVQLERN